MKVKVCYKVMVARNTELRSCWADVHKKDSLGLKYKIGEWVYTKEPTLPIFVFDTLENAQAYSKNLDVRIFKCLYKPSTHEVKYWGVAKTVEEELNFQTICGPNYEQLARWPEGTIFAEAVKPMREIT